MYEIQIYRYMELKTSNGSWMYIQYDMLLLQSYGVILGQVIISYMFLVRTQRTHRHKGS